MSDPDVAALLSKKSVDFDVLCRDKWLQVRVPCVVCGLRAKFVALMLPALQLGTGGRLYLGIRGVAELDIETRNSLPTCSLCLDIVVAVCVCVCL